ncbi:hypothetical protein HRD49_11205 [Corallococcus exiguus]|uniref:hypothetical protein n=1 Tax=Corallococcus TaxID=83461 RepID=UPI0013152074|nr:MULTISPECIES: hypothetical protein [Corallococcus]NNB88294.1 hypothetical protein [Corallococcus exiguus]NRD51936.1 hypothetical protein [Corallococcus exiguus]NRD62313.1 hypothetical protein [Corallococcus exiguus]
MDVALPTLPSEGAVNTTLTVVALSPRVAKSIAARVSPHASLPSVSSTHRAPPRPEP